MSKYIESNAISFEEKAQEFADTCKEVLIQNNQTQAVRFIRLLQEITKDTNYYKDNITIEEYPSGAIAVVIMNDYSEYSTIYFEDNGNFSKIY